MFALWTENAFLARNHKNILFVDRLENLCIKVFRLSAKKSQLHLSIAASKKTFSIKMNFHHCILFALTASIVGGEVSFTRDEVSLFTLAYCYQNQY